jgi:hypothetical protein
MYGVLGLSIFIPAVHGIMLHGWAEQNERMSLACRAKAEAFAFDRTVDGRGQGGRVPPRHAR